MILMTTGNYRIGIVLKIARVVWPLKRVDFVCQRCDAKPVMSWVLSGVLLVLKTGCSERINAPVKPFVVTMNPATLVRTKMSVLGVQIEVSVLKAEGNFCIYVKG